MLQQPLKLKSSVHLQPSDRRQLKQRVLQAFPNVRELELELVPKELMLVGFKTHLDERGAVYLGPNGDPLWFTIGKDSEEIIPTIYTLWKHPDLLPTLTTVPEEIPALTGGENLSISKGPFLSQTHQHGDVHPIHHKLVVGVPAAPPLQLNQLVAIAQDFSTSASPKAGPPLAVGRMTVSGEELSALVKKQGKRTKKHPVSVVHAWKDCLWGIGTDTEVPEPRDIAEAESDGEAIAEPTPEEVTSILRTALLQSISSSLLELPPSAFPIPADIFYNTHILPFRPAHPPFTTPIDIKGSSHKSLAAFLKAAEKEGLLQLKERRMHKNTELLVACVYEQEGTAAHQEHTTSQDVNEKWAGKAKAAKTEKKPNKPSKVKEMRIKEYRKASSQQAVAFVEAAGGDADTLYTMPGLERLITGYVASQNLTNANNAACVDVDDLLRATIAWEKQGHKTEDIKFIMRSKLTQRIMFKFQPWHKICVDGHDPVAREGPVKPISVVVKARNGDVSTRVSGFEPYMIEADFLANELNTICASADSGSPAQPESKKGRAVLVRGNHIVVVEELLVSMGVPKRCIKSVDQS
ncbi:hypothetical protein HWV62_12252 [Athelia sp. TMB]|nr:hypothetical protein HWV62_12252 [Athelia sp. TMB]